MEMKWELSFLHCTSYSCFNKQNALSVTEAGSSQMAKNCNCKIIQSFRVIFFANAYEKKVSVDWRVERLQMHTMFLGLTVNIQATAPTRFSEWENISWVVVV